MDEFRRHPYRCPLGRPDGLYRLDVFHDYGAFPVWGRDTVPPRAGRPARELLGSLNSEYLCISPQLGTDLRAWSDLHGGHGEWGARLPATDEEWEAHRLEGQVLAERPARATGAEVVYNWQWPDGDPECPHCGEQMATHLALRNGCGP